MCTYVLHRRTVTNNVRLTRCEKIKTFPWKLKLFVEEIFTARRGAVFISCLTHIRTLTLTRGNKIEVRIFDRLRVVGYKLINDIFSSHKWSVICVVLCNKSVCTDSVITYVPRCCFGWRGESYIGDADDHHQHPCGLSCKLLSAQIVPRNSCARETWINQVNYKRQIKFVSALADRVNERPY